MVMAVAAVTIFSCDSTGNGTTTTQQKVVIDEPDSTTHVSPVINFKFSINGEDNEMKHGMTHRFICIPHHGKAITPIIPFGQLYMDTLQVPKSMSLSHNTQLTFRVDMQKVLTSFLRDGYYVTETNARIHQKDFKGVFVAGDISPLSWQFKELANTGYAQLKDEDGDGIYEGTVVLNGR